MDMITLDEKITENISAAMEELTGTISGLMYLILSGYADKRTTLGDTLLAVEALKCVDGFLRTDTVGEDFALQLQKRIAEEYPEKFRTPQQISKMFGIDAKE